MSRRRLLQGGLGAAPVLMTLVSRPVLAQECLTPSAFVSGNASTGGQPALCTGLTPGSWKQSQHFSSWNGYYPTTVPGPGGHSATTFNSVFTPPFPNQGFTGPTLLQVLQTGGGPPNDVARHVVAALLNSAANKTPVLTQTAVKNIWTEYITTGAYSPTAGVSWNHQQIVDYLLTTMS